MFADQALLRPLFVASLLAGSLVACASPQSAPTASPDQNTGKPAQANAPQKSLGKPILAQPTPAAAPSEPIVLGYFTNWAHHRPAPCDFETADVDASLFSHINYAFALVEASEDKERYRVVPSSPDDEARLYQEVAALEEKNPKLEIFLSIGGWAFNDEPTEWIFSSMAETPERRGSFIRHTIAYVRKHGFDGIDIDWEFPGAPDRGGRPQDTENYTALLKEFRAQIVKEAEESGQPELLLTIAAPSGPHFRKHQQIDEFHPFLNWINVMTYDFHGSWEKKTGANAPLTGEDLSIQSVIADYKQLGVPAEKLVLGMATYARSWGGVDEAKPGAAATGEGPQGPCGKDSFSAHQVEAAIERGEYEGHWDETSQTPYAYSPDSKAYLTYDNERSIALKLDFLKEQDLAGAMFWAIDLDDFKGGYPIISQVAASIRPDRSPGTSAEAAARQSQ